jgi:uncharacterized repeat protein (TIGR03809 family)
MTHRLDVARNRALSARWCALAEKRLEHLTELFESGRWRRYYSEYAFLENIQEAKLAVKNWRALSLGEPFTPRRNGFWLTIADGQRSLEPATPAQTQMAESYQQPIVRPPTIETVVAQSDIIVPEYVDESDDAEDILMPEEIIAPEIAPLAPRIDMAALEDAISVDLEEEEATPPPPPVFDLDEIARRYPALRHAL